MQVLKDEISKRILEVAEDLFYKAGFEGTTTRSIATSAGIRVSNLYLYYENKEAIFAAVIDPFYRYLNLRLQEILVFKNTKEDINNKLSILLGNFIVKDRKKFIILTDRSRGTKYEHAKDMAVHVLTAHVNSLLADAMNDKELISKVLAYNLINGIVELAKSYKDESQLDESLKHLITYHTRGIEALLS